jgi:hypothetical protein
MRLCEPGLVLHVYVCMSVFLVPMRARCLGEAHPSSYCQRLCYSLQYCLLSGESDGY